MKKRERCKKLQGYVLNTIYSVQLIDFNSYQRYPI
jgi:hypothetical protein